jgi:catechol 2,3-dioxygenase-like lactoylglutathione lyase family enzyme
MLLPRLPQRLHHYAFVVRDQETNRQFFEDVLGLPLVATWCERVFHAGLARWLAGDHTPNNLDRAHATATRG